MILALPGQLLRALAPACFGEIVVFPDGLVLVRKGPLDVRVFAAIRIGDDEVSALRDLVEDARLRTEMDWLGSGRNVVEVYQATNDLGEPVELIAAGLDP
ncbi:MAG: hypothetical protein ACRDHD_05515 [Candidatus Limnocylindria bacterium]